MDDCRAEDIRDDWDGRDEPLRAVGGWDEMDILPHYRIHQSRVLSVHISKG